MNKKIVLSVVLILSLVLSFANISFADDTFKLNLRAEEWTQNENGEMVFDAYISFENNPGVASVGFSFEYDQDLLVPVEVVQLDALSIGGTQTNIDQCQKRAADSLKFALFNGANQYDDGDAYKVTFKVAKYASVEDSEVSTEMKLVVNPRGRFYSETWEEITPVYGSTTLTMPVIESEGEEYVPEDPADSEGSDDSGDTGLELDPEELESLIGGLTRPSDTTNIPTNKKYNTVIILTIDSVNIKVNNNTLINDVAPIIVNDRTMLPIRFVAEELGGEVTWDEANQKVTVSDGNKTITVYIDSDIAYVNDEVVKLDSPAFIQNDRTYLPLRFISENLGAEVDWDGDLQQVTVRK